MSSITAAYYFVCETYIDDSSTTVKSVTRGKGLVLFRREGLIWIVQPVDQALWPVVSTSLCYLTLRIDESL